MTTRISDHRRAGRGALRAVAAACGVLLALGSAAFGASSALADYGDRFGIADVNTPGSSSAPAFPGTTAFWAGTCDLSRPTTGDGGTGAAPSNPGACIDYGSPNSDVGAALWTTAPSWRLDAVTQAGAHPDASTAFWFRRAVDAASGGGASVGGQPDGNARDVAVRLPAGVIGHPEATPKCSSADAQTVPPTCPPQTQIGVSTISISQISGVIVTVVSPVYNVEPRRGNAAEFLIGDAGAITNIPIVARVRATSDFGVDTVVTQIPGGLPLLGQSLTLWGVPWAASHDLWREPAGLGTIPAAGLPADQRQRYDAGWGVIQPFFDNPTECSGRAPVTTITTDSWQHPVADLVTQGVSAESPAPAVTGCDRVPFAPTASFQPTSTAPDSASGLAVDIGLPQNDTPPAGVAENPDDATGAPAYWKTDAGLATADLKRAVVTLPAGVAINPSAAAGLAGCGDDQMGFHPEDSTFTDAEPTCPDGAKIGGATVTTPLLDTPLTGDIFLGSPRSTDPQSGQMFRLFLVLRNADRGQLDKLYGTAVADPITGQLTATFDNNPRIPFDHLHLDFKGGVRGVFAMPQTCGTATTTSTFTPWTAAAAAGGSGVGGGQAVSVPSSFAVGGACSFGFAPSLAAGMSSPLAGGSGSFSFRFARNDGEQWITGLTASLPAGLLASVKGVALCSGADAAAGTCSAASRIGSVDAGAGSGSPFFLATPGSAYLTEGYKGCAYGLSVVVPVEAGPFTGAYGLGNIVVRQALCVDANDAHVTIASDPFPTIWHGIPLRIRQVTVDVDRPGFMVNPTSCAAKQIVSSFVSAQGATATASAPFQATGCAALPYAPRLALSLSNKTQTSDGGHPGVEAFLTQTGGQAGVRSVKVTLPLSLALDPDNANGLCEFADGLKDDCPKASIVGRASAVSPLLNRPLAGDVYFVKGVRANKEGQLIKTLPTLLVELRGEIAIDLRATSEVDGKGRLVNTFGLVPDAPISAFDLRLTGGRHGIIVVTHNQDVCRGSQVAFADTDAQNGTRSDFDTTMRTPCGLAVARIFTSSSVHALITGIGAGRITVSGTGVKTASRTIKASPSATVVAELTATGRRMRRANHDVRLRVSFVPAGAKKAKVAYSAKPASAKKATSKAASARGPRDR